MNTKSTLSEVDKVIDNLKRKTIEGSDELTPIFKDVGSVSAAKLNEVLSYSLEAVCNHLTDLDCCSLQFLRKDRNTPVETAEEAV